MILTTNISAKVGATRFFRILSTDLTKRYLKKKKKERIGYLFDHRSIDIAKSLLLPLPNIYPLQEIEKREIVDKVGIAAGPLLISVTGAYLNRRRENLPLLSSGYLHARIRGSDTPTRIMHVVMRERELREREREREGGVGGSHGEEKEGVNG